MYFDVNDNKNVFVELCLCGCGICNHHKCSVFHCYDFIDYDICTVLDYYLGGIVLLETSKDEDVVLPSLWACRYGT